MAHFSPRAVGCLLVLSLGAWRSSVCAQDCDGDGTSDALEIAPARLQLASPVAVSDGSEHLLAADLDGDGRQELILHGAQGSVVTACWNQGSRELSPPDVVGDLKAPVTQVAAGDLTGDGAADLVLQSRGEAVFICKSDHTRTLGTPEILVEAPGELLALVLADLDGDGRSDLIFVQRTSGLITLRLTDPRPGVEASTLHRFSWPLPDDPTLLANIRVLDIDGDGALDLAASTQFSPWQIHHGRGDGTVGEAQVLGDFVNIRNPVAADLSSDGRQDLVWWNAGSLELRAVLGSATRAHSSVRLGTLPRALGPLASGDMDGDADDDLLLAASAAGCYPQPYSLDLLEQVGGRILEPLPLAAIPPTLSAIVPRDFDGDCRIDIATSEFDRNGGLDTHVQVFWNGAATTTRDCDGDLVPDDCELPANDCNLNGLLDRCEVAQGKTPDCDGNGIPDVCDRDCDHNGLPDACELAQGASDVDRDGILDVCRAPIVDCNLNGLDDALEIAEGRVTDCNLNGVPDPCETSLRWRFVSGVSDGQPLRWRPTALATGDWNGDGHEDLVVGDSAGCCSRESPIFGLEAYLGDGRRKFRPLGRLGLSKAAGEIKPVDFDGDGRLDLLIRASAGESCTENAEEGGLLLEGGGDGSFDRQRSLFTAHLLLGLEWTDLESDGDLDLAYLEALEVGSRIVLLENNGQGGLREVAAFATPDVSTTFKTGDVDGDGDVELIRNRSEARTLDLLSRTAPTTHEVVATVQLEANATPTTLALGDLDGDLDLDLVVGESPVNGGVPAPRCRVLRAGAGWRFAPWIVEPLLNVPARIELCDANSDGFLEVISWGPEHRLSSSGLLHGLVTALPNRGDGSFGASTRSWLPPGMVDAAAASIDGDELLDLAVVTSVGPGLTVLQGKEDGGFEGLIDSPEATEPTDLAVADLTGDGLPDFAVFSIQAQAVQVLGASQPLGGYPVLSTTPLGAVPLAIEAGDLDADGNVDVALAERGRLETLLGDGHGLLGRLQFLPVGSAPFDVGLADLDGDDDLDVVTANALPNNPGLADNISIFENGGKGALGTPRNYVGGRVHTSVTPGDLTGDGLPELLLTCADAEDRIVFRNEGDLSFTRMALPARAEFVEARRAALLDFDGDGDLDIALVHLDGITLINNVDGTFPGARLLPGGAYLDAAAADFDGDGNVDLALAHAGEESSILPGAGDGSFREAVKIQTHRLPGVGGGASGDGSPEVRRNHIRVADLDRDGRPDFACTFPEWNRIGLLRNVTERALVDEDRNGILDVCEGRGLEPFVRGDVNADGTIAITDAITVLRHLFLGEGAPSCERAADLDDEGQITLTDGVRILRFLFLGDSAPSAPWPECGLDLTVDPLSCESFAPCGAPPR